MVFYGYFKLYFSGYSQKFFHEDFLQKNARIFDKNNQIVFPDIRSAISWRFFISNMPVMIIGQFFRDIFWESFKKLLRDFSRSSSMILFNNCFLPVNLARSFFGIFHKISSYIQKFLHKYLNVWILFFFQKFLSKLPQGGFGNFSRNISGFFSEVFQRILTFFPGVASTISLDIKKLVI